MEQRSIYTSLSRQEADRRIQTRLTESAGEGAELSRRELPGPGGTACVVSVYQKYYFAAEHIAMVVTVDDLEGRTRVTCATFGKSQGADMMDWGCGGKMAGLIARALEGTVEE